MKGRRPRVIAITGTNHGVGNVRITEAHATPAGVGGFNRRARIDLSPRGGLACLARELLFGLSFFSTSPSPPLLPPLETAGECVFTLRKHLSLLRHVARRAAEIEYEIPRAWALEFPSALLLCRTKLVRHFLSAVRCRYSVRRSLKILAEWNKSP